MSPHARLLAVMGLLAMSCGTAEPTQVMVVIDAEAEVRSRTVRLHVDVRGFDEGGDQRSRAAYDRTFGEDEYTLEWPRRVSLAPFGGDAQRLYEVTATALDQDDESIARVRARSGYVKGKQLELWLLLEDGCIGMMCGTSETCTGGACQNADVDVTTLIPFGAEDFGSGTSTGGQGSSDAGMDRSDAGGSSMGTGGTPPEASACGDRELTGTENCDTGIDAGQPGACPTQCPPTDACRPLRLVGTACQAECVVEPKTTCQNDDSCCPGTCTANDDNDCSENCGDMVLQPAMGEKCEPGSSTPCPVLADCDDMDACTRDSVTGSATNCTAECVHTAVTTPTAGDTCCPETANANTDNDCMPMCGNGVVESGEDCDGGGACGTNCKAALTPTQQDCVDRLVLPGSPIEDCQRCACLKCTNDVFACRDDADMTRRMKCDVLLTCSLNQDCTGTACFCGTDALCLAPNGPCQMETAAAADVSYPNPNLVTLFDHCNNASTRTMWACGRASILGECTAAMCPSCPQP